MTNDLHPDDHGGGDDGDIITLVRSAGLDTDATFVADLRATLLTEADTTSDGAVDTNIISLTPSEPDSQADNRDRRRWPLLAAAAAVLAIGIGAIALVSQRGDDSAIITDDPPDIGSTIDDPVAFLDGETWVLIGRSDTYPSARTPVFTAEMIDDDTLAVTGNDGCRPTALTLVFADGVLQRVGTAGTPGDPCDDDESTPLTWTIGDYLARTELGFGLPRGEAEPVIEFARVDDLPVATADDLEGDWLLDRLAPVTIDADRFGIGFWGCVDATRYPWQVTDGALTVDGLYDDYRERCNPPPSGLILDEHGDRFDLAEVLAGPAPAVRADEDIVLFGSDRAITLRPLPEARPDAAGITIAAGSAFGLQPAVGIGPSEVLDAVTPELGDPTFDSGWIDVPRTLLVVCSDGPNEYRELHWNDLSFGFWRRGARVSFHYWIIGDRDELFFDVPVAGAPLDPPASGLTTEHGVIVGDDPSLVVGPGIYRRFFDDRTRILVDVVSQQGAGGYTATDGRITSILSVNNTC